MEEMKPKYLKLQLSSSPKANPLQIEDKFVLDSSIGKDIKMNQAYTFSLRMPKLQDKKTKIGFESGASTGRKNSSRATHNFSICDESPQMT